jgi:hypothetical protein
MKKGDVVSLVALTGEYVGKYEDESPNGIILKDPRWVIHGEQGMGFAHGLCSTGKQNPDKVEFNRGGIIYVVESSEEIEKAYRQAVSGLIV